jgi:hypothetical protein
MKRIVGLLAGLACWSCMSAWAQPVSPVLQHYRAYQAALEANDLATAEREAASALAASEARDGDGGRTAVLALNLAGVRLLADNASGALQPGRRALDIAEARGEDATGVSPALARLLVSRAELGAGDAAAAQRLAAALTAAQQARVPSEEIYDGAIQLASWTFSAERYDEARAASAIAARHAEGSRASAHYARAAALTGEAAALILGELARSGRSSQLGPDAARQARALLDDAIIALRPLAAAHADGELTTAQLSYAQALAWASIIRTASREEVAEAPEARSDADGLTEIDIPPSVAEQPRCLVRIRLRDSVQLFPADNPRQAEVGGLALRFRLNETGELRDVSPLAAVGNILFDEWVEDRGAWRIERRADSPANCRMAMSVIQSISLTVR